MLCRGVGGTYSRKGEDFIRKSGEPSRESKGRHRFEDGDEMTELWFGLDLEGLDAYLHWEHL